MKNFCPKATSILFVVVLLSGCDLIKMKEDPAESEITSEPIARVHDQYLHPEDMEGIVTSQMSPEDSAVRVERFVNNWIKKQLLIHEASTN